MQQRKMPIGIQDFEDLRSNGYVYVDKTAYVYRLVSMGKPYFLSRPRRFGKSLLLSTLKYYFSGKKDLFEGLAISALEKDWVEYPVLHLDFNVGEYTSLEGLKEMLATRLLREEARWGRDAGETSAAARFEGLIRRACEKTGRKVVVLIDEYDKPLLETMHDDALNESFRVAIKPFFGVLKSADQYLRFVMLTGVTRFSKVSIFSDLNQLIEISMDDEYAAVCGITEKELIDNFKIELESLAEKQEKTFEETVSLTRKNFNGYHFAKGGESVYNPFSLLNTFNRREFDYYWFATGTPTFLFTELERTNYDLLKFQSGISVDANELNNYRSGNSTPVPLLYQSGYLTITGYDAETGFYDLGFPNEEVKHGFLRNLLQFIVPASADGNTFNIRLFLDALRKGDVDGFMTALRAFFSGIPYDLHHKKTESYYQTIFYIIFELLGKYIAVEERSAAGRADAVVKTGDTIYVFEFKLAKASGGALDSIASAALEQIEESGYLIPYTVDGRRLVKIGVVFDTNPKKRTIGAWKIV